MEKNYHFLGTEKLSGTQRKTIDDISKIYQNFITNMQNHIEANHNIFFDKYNDTDVLDDADKLYLGFRYDGCISEYTDELITYYTKYEFKNSGFIKTLNINDLNSIKKNIITNYIQEWLYIKAKEIFNNCNIATIEDKYKFLFNYNYLSAVYLGDKKEIYDLIGISKLDDLILSTTKVTYNDYNSANIGVTFKDDYYMFFFFKYINNSGNIDLNKINDNINNFINFMENIEVFFNYAFINMNQEIQLTVIAYLDSLKFEAIEKVETVMKTSNL